MVLLLAMLFLAKSAAKINDGSDIAKFFNLKLS